MISKLIVHAPTREKAIQKIIKAIDNYTIFGVKTTLPFCKYALNHSDFRSGKFDTRFVSLYFKDFKNNFSNQLFLDTGLAAIYHLEKMNFINDSFLPSVPNQWRKS